MNKPQSKIFCDRREVRIKNQRRFRNMVAKKALDDLPEFLKTANAFEKQMYCTGAKRVERAVKCRSNVVKGKPVRCRAPVLCEYCMAVRRAELANPILKHLSEHPRDHIFGWNHGVSYLIPRGIYKPEDGDSFVPLKRLRVEDSCELSRNGIHIDRCYGDGFYSMTENLMHLLSVLKQERAKSIRYLNSRKGCIGCISLIHSVPVNDLTCKVELNTLSLWEGKPEGKEKFEVEHREGCNLSQYTMKREWGSDPVRITTRNVIPQLHRVLRSDVRRLTHFLPEELLIHQGALLQMKILNTSGDLFREYHVREQNP